MNRVVEPELLDLLPITDQRAAISRSDLRRVNRLMRHAEILAARIKRAVSGNGPWSFADLGAGDGVLALRILHRLPPLMRPVSVTLVDRVSVVDDSTLRALASLGCELRVVRADVFEWLESAPFTTVFSANLFLHHFASADLDRLLALIESHCAVFVACEPGRSRLNLHATQLLRLLGCNEVTRHDAVASVHAGFTPGELSCVWPNIDRWSIDELRIGLFTHLFAAEASESGQLQSAKNRIGHAVHA